VPAPEAAMNEDYFTPRWENQIGFPGQLRTMQTIAVTQRMNELAYGEFRLRVFGADCRHDTRTGTRIDVVSHGLIVSNSRIATAMGGGKV